jgi:hypothetical protein
VYVKAERPSPRRVRIEPADIVFRKAFASSWVDFESRCATSAETTRQLERRGTMKEM